MSDAEAIVAFLNARLDEDERTAKAAAKANPDGEEWYADPDPQVWGVGGGTPVLRGDGNGLAMAIGSYAADHIARHDPARVLREVEAGRKLLALLEQDVTDGRERDYEATEMLEQVVRIRAAIWDDHPDYRQAWKP